jgi:hypothetical protein
VSGRLAPGVRVQTPHGPAVIVDQKTLTLWSFGRPRKKTTLSVRYPNGRRGVWFPDRLTVIGDAAREKAEHPEIYCPYRDCLWRTGGGWCPRHDPEADRRGEA